MNRRRAPAPRWPKVLAGLMIGVILLSLMVVGIKSLMGEKSGKPRKPPTVTLLPDKPPPPPPPPKEEKRPEPPKDQAKEVKVVQTEQTPQAQNEPLKMEGAAGEGGGPFAAGTVGRDYVGGDIGKIGGAGMSAFSSRLQRHYQEQLSRNRKLRGSDYRVIVKLWLNRDGSLERVELAGSTGTENLDLLLRETLQQIAPLRESLPENTVQPIRIRVTNRGAA